MPGKQQGDRRRPQRDKPVGNRPQDPQKFREQRMQTLRQLYMSGGEDVRQGSENQTESRRGETARTEEMDGTVIARSVSGSIGSLEICIPSHSTDLGECDLEAEAEDLLTWTDQLTDDALNT